MHNTSNYEGTVVAQSKVQPAENLTDCLHPGFEKGVSDKAGKKPLRILRVFYQGCVTPDTSARSGRFKPGTNNRTRPTDATLSRQ